MLGIPAGMSQNGYEEKEEEAEGEEEDFVWFLCPEATPPVGRP